MIQTLQRSLLLLLLLLFLLLVLGVSLPAWAQQGHGQMHPRYDADAEETLDGQAVRIDSMAMGDHVGLHLMLQVEADTIEVHLGPSWFFARQAFQLQPGDTLTVTGVRIVHEGAPALIARTVRRGVWRLVLRDAEGYPVWRGWRRQGTPGEGG